MRDKKILGLHFIWTGSSNKLSSESAKRQLTIRRYRTEVQLLSKGKCERTAADVAAVSTGDDDDDNNNDVIFSSQVLRNSSGLKFSSDVLLQPVVTHEHSCCCCCCCCCWWWWWRWCSEDEDDDVSRLMTSKFLSWQPVTMSTSVLLSSAVRCITLRQEDSSTRCRSSPVANISRFYSHKSQQCVRIR